MAPTLDLEKQKARNEISMENSRIYFVIAIITSFAAISTVGIFLYLLIDGNSQWYIPLVFGGCASFELAFIFLLFVREKRRIISIQNQENLSS